MNGEVLMVTYVNPGQGIDPVISTLIGAVGSILIIGGGPLERLVMVDSSMVHATSNL